MNLDESSITSNSNKKSKNEKFTESWVFIVILLAIITSIAMGVYGLQILFKIYCKPKKKTLDNLASTSIIGMTTITPDTKQNEPGTMKEKDKVHVQHQTRENEPEGQQETKLEKTESEIVYQNDETNNQTTNDGTPGGELENETTRETKDKSNEHSSSEALFVSEQKETVTGGL